MLIHYDLCPQLVATFSHDLDAKEDWGGKRQLAVKPRSGVFHTQLSLVILIRQARKEGPN